MSGTPFRKRTGSEEEVAYGNGSAMARKSKALNLFAEFQKAAAAGNVSAYGALAMSESELRKAAAAKAAATKAAKAEAKAAAAAKAKATRNAKKAATASGGAAGGAGRGNNNNTRNNRSNRAEEKELDALTALIQTWVIAKKDPGYIGRLFGALKKTPEIVKAHVTKDQAALLTKRSFVTKLEAKFTAPNV
jgi:chemotaxis protein histidine kinase CheA